MSALIIKYTHAHYILNGKKSVCSELKLNYVDKLYSYQLALGSYM